MDFTVYPDTRISRLPRALRPLALLVRNLIPAGIWRYRYPYRADDMATNHYCPFLDDPGFNELYARVTHHWHGGRLDRRWRLWTLVGLARQRAGFPQDSPANFAEFGVYRGGSTFMVLSTAELAPEQRYFLFDTFEGIPADGRLTETELELGLAGFLADTSTKQVLELLNPWRSRLELCEGNVFETLEQVETGALSLVHMDLNGAAATVRALEYAYPRLVPGAIIVFDDYGLHKFETQRRAVDEFFAEKPEQVVALPTSQGLLIKR